MKVVVNDANILIDLVELELLPHFFALDFEFLTTDFVLNELYDTQYQVLLPYINHEILAVHEITNEELSEVYSIQISKPTLSEQDCSAFYQARINAATLITSDNNLRSFAKEEALEVHGHLWVFDCMVYSQTITGKMACEKLKELRESVNPKLGLPEAECNSRIKKWRNSDV